MKQRQVRRDGTRRLREAWGRMREDLHYRRYMYTNLPSPTGARIRDTEVSNKVGGREDSGAIESIERARGTGGGTGSSRVVAVRVEITSVGGGSEYSSRGGTGTVTTLHVPSVCLA